MPTCRFSPICPVHIILVCLCAPSSATTYTRGEVMMMLRMCRHAWSRISEWFLSLTSTSTFWSGSCKYTLSIKREPIKSRFLMYAFMREAILVNFLRKKCYILLMKVTNLLYAVSKTCWRNMYRVEKKKSLSSPLKKLSLGALE